MKDLFVMTTTAVVSWGDHYGEVYIQFSTPAYLNKFQMFLLEDFLSVCFSSKKKSRVDIISTKTLDTKCKRKNFEYVYSWTLLE